MNVTLIKIVYLVWIQYLILNFPWKAWMNCKSIYSSPDSITEIFTMICGKEVVLSSDESLSKKPMTYPGRLGDWSTDLSTKTLAPKKQFSSFLFSVVFPQKIRLM